MADESKSERQPIQQHRRGGKSSPARGIPATEEYDRGPAPPEQSNRDHPGAAGVRRAVPGEGIVHSTSDAPGITHPQHVPAAQSSSPGARRKGTTNSSPEGVHGGDSVGAPAGPLDNETTSDGSKAPLSVPGVNMGPPAGGDEQDLGPPDIDDPASGPNQPLNRKPPERRSRS
jgi:hypothetical protein